MITLPARATHDAMAAFAREAAAAVAAEPGGKVVVDVAGLTEFDSSALAVLLECRRHALDAGKAFAVSGLSGRMSQLATVYGVAELIPAVA
jgi:phospholipid transport system transporter-binding protein